MIRILGAAERAMGGVQVKDLGEKETAEVMSVLLIFRAVVDEVGYEVFQVVPEFLDRLMTLADRAPLTGPIAPTAFLFLSAIMNEPFENRAEDRQRAFDQRKAHRERFRFTRKSEKLAFEKAAFELYGAENLRACDAMMSFFIDEEARRGTPFHQTYANAVASLDLAEQETLLEKGLKDALIALAGGDGDKPVVRDPVAVHLICEIAVKWNKERQPRPSCLRDEKWCKVAGRLLVQKKHVQELTEKGKAEARPEGQS
jgi:hypothetical protein